MKVAFIPNLVIYHDPCSDGFGAAYSIYYRYMEEHITYVRGRHDKKKFDEDFWVDLVKGKKVVICDFSFPREQLLKMHEAADQLVLLDHHVSAQEELGDLDFCFFDMEKSGACITWEAFHDDPPPRLIQYIQDKDLNRFNLPQSEYILTYIEAEKRDFEAWRVLHMILQNDREFIRSANWGQQMLAYRNNIIKELGEDPETWEIDGHKVIATNCSWLRNEVAHLLLEDESSEGVAGCYWIHDGKIHWSLRSTEEVDVSELAKKFGGGGHAQASGFSTEFTKAMLTKRKI